MAAAQCRSSKCTAERKGFRRELDSWRHKLIHCVGFESILEGIYGPMLLRDLNIFDDCEPEEVDDWSGEASCSHCSFCNLPLDKLCDQIPAAASPLSSPSDYSPCQATTLSESSQSAHRFLQAVFHKKDESFACDSNIPLVAQKLMEKMIHQFAMEYASKSPINTTTNGLTTGTSSPQSDMLDAPLDLTVSRSQEEREPQPDGVLDLSKRTSACSASSSSANNKASGFLLPSFTEELGDPGRWETQCGQNSALKAVLCSLCPAHRSLLYQILKVAHQERLLSLPHHRPVGQTDSQCCHRGVTSQDNVTPCPFPFSECKARSSSPHYPITDCDHQGHNSTLYHPADSKSNCSVHHYPFCDCKSKAPQGSACCCVQSCRVAAYPVFCLKSLHCISCQSLAVGHIDNVVCSFASTPSLSQSPTLCTSSSSLFPASSICCSHHNPHPCPCYSNHACLAQVRNTIEGSGGDGDPPCPVLKREQSPSPPPLSPIPSDINRKTEEKPPSLLCHRHDDRADLSLPLMVKDDLMDASQQEVGLDTATEEELECRTPRRSQAEQNPNRSLLQDVVDRFSEKLETIRPLEKDPPQTSSAIHTIEKEQPLSPSANQSLQFHDDAHLSEIITTVLHTGSDSDYNLSELFNRHDNNEAKSPNTRSRRRQEVLAAMAPITPADHASTRRHSLQIKRELAMFDSPYCRKKLSRRVRLKDSNTVTLSTSSSSDTTPVKEESERQMGIQEMKGLGPKQEMDKIRKEIWKESVMVGEDSITKDKEIESMTEQEEDKIIEVSRIEKGIEDAGIERVRERQGNMLTAEKERVEIKEEIHAVIVTEEIETIKVEEKERKIATEEKEQIAPDTQILMTEQTKYYNLGLKGESLQSEIVAVTTASMTQCRRACEIDGEGSNFGNDTNQDEVQSSQSSDSDSTPDRGKAYHRPIRGRKMTSFPSLSSHSRDARRSRRNIVPPQRFSSYVTEPRKMYFVACFSESIFNQRTPKDKASKSSTLHGFSKIPDVKAIQLESRKDGLLSSPEPTGELFFESTSKEPFGTYTEDQSQVFPLTVAATEKSPTIHSSQNRTDVRDCAAMPYRRLRSSPLQDIKTASRTPRNFSKCGVTSSDSSATCVQSPPNTQIQYISPIKLMYVSPVMDEDGVKYSLKSAASGSSGQAEEPFDPCEESSWAGTVEKKKSQGAESVTSQIKSISSPLKSATSPAKSSSTPPKSASSPPKSASSSPKSASSSPRVGARRSGEGTPPKRAVGTENSRSPGDLIPFHETTPPKRRPGRPKKLGPQLEKKVKRPIGRPRKQRALDPIMGVNAENVNTVLGSDIEENTNKNLKITVVYGRSRRNKRLVSEGFDQLQTELHDAWQAVGRDHDLSSLTQSSQTSSGSVTAASTDWSDELNLVRPVKDRESAPHSSSNIKCQKIEGAVPIRKPGRPAKVKISGISVTVTTVSPRQRKIQMNRDARQSPQTLSQKKALLPVFKSAKEPWTINLQTSSDHSQIEGKDESRDRQTDRPLAVRHSVRVRKPSVYLLHSVATSTSRSYSHSTALLRRSKQLLLNKASNERKREEARGGGEIPVEKRQLFGQERKRISQDLGQVAGVSVDSIFPPREAVRWWTASAEEKTLNQELARRIRLVSDTWVSDSVEKQEETAFKSRLGIKGITAFTKKPRHSSVVRMLFDCPPNKPSSCSMQQLCSWFMQTTETQSLAIVKKASSRNPYELMHYPHSADKSVCPSPQAERLRKHIKKFAKTVPKSPCEHQRAQERLRNRNKASFSTDKIKRQLFTPRFAPGRLNQGAPWWRGRALGKYPTTLLRARARFLTRKERDRWPKRHRNNQKEFKWRLAASLNGDVVTALQPRHKAFSRSATRQLFDCLESSCTTSSADQTQEPMDVPKEHRLSSKAWSPETLKECRVFLKKINSPDNESTAEEEWDSCTVTLDDGSPPAYCFAGRERELTGVVKAVKTERKRRKRATASRELANLASKSSHEQDEVQPGRQKRKYKSPGVVSTEPPQPPPPPAKMLRQSRVKGLTGPRWCDFVFEN